MISFHRFLLMIAAALIFAIGLIMIFNTSSAEILDLNLGTHKNLHHALFKQMLYAFSGALLGFGIYKLGYIRFLKLSPRLLIIFTFLIVLTFVPYIGREVNGSKRWINLAGYSLQPSEFIKIIIPAAFIYFTCRYTFKSHFEFFKKQLTYKSQINATFDWIMDSFRNPSLNQVSLNQTPSEAVLQCSTLPFADFMRIIGIVSIPMVLILLQPNHGTVGVIALTVIMLCALTRIRFTYWALPLIICLIVGGISASQMGYVKARIQVYWNPEIDIKGRGHQPLQAKIAAGSGQFLGKGPGNSLQKLSYLPEAQNDYIAAIYAEEFGFAGILLLITLYMIIAYIGFYIAIHAATIAGFYLAISITFLISFQAFLNLGVVSGLLPSTGLNLPFFSQGGSSLMANIVGLSLLLNIENKAKKT